MECDTHLPKAQPSPQAEEITPVSVACVPHPGVEIIVGARSTETSAVNARAFMHDSDDTG